MLKVEVSRDISRTFLGICIYVCVYIFIHAPIIYAISEESLMIFDQGCDVFKVICYVR